LFTNQRSGGSGRNCFGRENYYRHSDYACKQCSDRAACVAEINQTGRRPPTGVGAARARVVPNEVGVEMSSTTAGQVLADETALTRFLKDCATGAARGWSFEQYQFFCNFRF